MTPEQAVAAVKAVQPKIYYPYHYGQVEEPTDVEALAKMLEGVTDVRIRPLA
jgi:L-ascorbate metabolism protein UlaG (beta-lactamase superfamily)